MKEINIHESSDETLYALMHYSNATAKAINDVLQSFRKDLIKRSESHEGMEYHFTVLEDLLSGDSKESFDFVKSHFQAEQNNSIQNITDLSEHLNFHISMVQNVVAELNTRQ